MAFEKAKQRKTFLRLFLSGSTGTGKTYSALKIAKGIQQKTNGKIGVIDTEHGKSTLNSNWIDFMVENIDPPYKVEDYIEAIKKAAGEFDILIIDSISHAWKNVLMRIDEIIEANSKENFRAWGIKGEGTNLQYRFVETLLAYPGHLIVTCRSKMKHKMKVIGNRMSIVKLGMGNVQRDGIEYEFDFILEASDNAIDDHTFIVSKDRTNKFQSKELIPDEDLGVDLLNLLSAPDGDFITVDFPDIRELKKKIKVAMSYFDDKEADEFAKKNLKDWKKSRSINDLDEFLEKLRVKYRQRK